MLSLSVGDTQMSGYGFTSIRNISFFLVSSAQAQHTPSEDPKGVEGEDGTCDSRPITQRAGNGIS